MSDAVLGNMDGFGKSSARSDDVSVSPPVGPENGIILGELDTPGTVDGQLMGTRVRCDAGRAVRALTALLRNEVFDVMLTPVE